MKHIYPICELSLSKLPPMRSSLFPIQRKRGLIDLLVQSKRLGLILLTLLALSVSAFGQVTTTFTATINAASNWNNAAIWVKTGGVTNATYPGQTGYVGENAGDIHHVVINTFDATARTLTLNVSIANHVGNVTINNEPGTATLSIGNNSLTMSGDLSGAGTIIFGSGILNIAGNNIQTGIFTCGTGTVNYNGGAQLVKSTVYNNFTISGSGDKTMQGDISIGGTATFNTAGCALVINGNMLSLNNATAGNN